METDTDIEIKMLKQREKEISKVVNRYMRIRLKRRIRKVFGLRLRWKSTINIKWKELKSDTNKRKTVFLMVDLSVEQRNQKIYILEKPNIKTTLNFS